MRFHRDICCSNTPSEHREDVKTSKKEKKYNETETLDGSTTKIYRNEIETSVKSQNRS